jgi:hypothetical protein
MTRRLRLLVESAQQKDLTMLIPNSYVSETAEPDCRQAGASPSTASSTTLRTKWNYRSSRQRSRIALDRYHNRFWN